MPSKHPAEADLLQAIAQTRSARVRQLLRATPELARGWKPIMDAAFTGWAEGVRLLLAAGADANQVSPNSHRHTPLVRAVEWKKTNSRTSGHREVVHALLDAGADSLQRGGVHQWTPLAHALMSDEADLARLLVPVHALDLPHAAMAYDVVLVRKLLRRQGAPGDVRDAVGRNALHYLCASGLHRRQGSSAALAIAALLLDAGADVDAQQTNLIEEGWAGTPLWWAVAWQQHYGLAEHLLHAGAAAQPALFAAAVDGDEGTLKLLLAHGARLEHRIEGRTVLMDIMRFKRPRHLALLLAAGADARAADADGNTALHFAVQSAVRPEAVALLVQHGADPSCRNAAGASPRSLAKQLGRKLPL